jgi:hypothetical protein
LAGDQVHDVQRLLDLGLFGRKFGESILRKAAEDGRKGFGGFKGENNAHQLVVRVDHLARASGIVKLIVKAKKCDALSQAARIRGGDVVHEVKLEALVRAEPHHGGSFALPAPDFR